MRGRLLEAAARVMANQGSDSAKIDTFIRAAGVARGTFYNHFKTREELLEALWTSIGHDPFLEQFSSACNKLTDPAERFAAVTRLVLLRAAEDPTWGWRSSRCRPMRRLSTMICAAIRVRTCGRVKPPAVSATRAKQARQIWSSGPCAPG